MSDAPVKPIRLQRRRVKGFRLTSPNGLPVVCVTRPGKWGNPFSRQPTPEQNVSAYFYWLIEKPEGRELAEQARNELRGKNLACYCEPGKPCHADVLLTIANEDRP